MDLRWQVITTTGTPPPPLPPPPSNPDPDEETADRFLQERVENIVVLMLENRSFDHMLGYLSLRGRTDMDGLKKDELGRLPSNLLHEKPEEENPGEVVKSVEAFELDNTVSLVDPPHNVANVRKQIGISDNDELPPKGSPAMTGFVDQMARAVFNQRYEELRNQGIDEAEAKRRARAESQETAGDLSQTKRARR